jgi:hypothetical protein
MSEKKMSLTSVELENHRANNYIVMTLLPILYLNEQDQSIKEYTNFLGKILTKTWKQAKDAPIQVIAKMIAINYAAAGASHISSIVTDNQIIIKIKNWPPKKLLEFLGAKPETINDFHYIWEPIANYLDMSFNLEISENEYQLQFNKK